MPYDPNLAFGSPNNDVKPGKPSGSQPNTQGRQTAMANLLRPRDEPRGISRYFQVQPRDSKSQQGYMPLHSHTPVTIPGPVSVPASTPPPATVPSRITATRPPPSKPAPAQTPSRLTVVLQSSQHRQSSQSPSKRPAEDPATDMNMITSDIHPPHQPRPTSSAIQTGTPTSANKPEPTRPPADLQTPATLPAAPRRRGRPFGWRAGMGSYTAQRLNPNPNPAAATNTAKKPPASAGPPKRRGRPPGRPSVHPARAIWAALDPAYVPFLCEWAGCPAELQNADTLRRHVRVVHGRRPASGGGGGGGGGSVCRWGKCAEEQQSGPAGHDCGSAEGLERHVENAHLVPLVWHVGDGPKNSGLVVPAAGGKGARLPGYLFDKDGNQVTPSVAGQAFETEEERKGRKRKLARLIMERDRNAPFEEEGPGSVEVEMDG